LTQLENNLKQKMEDDLKKNKNGSRPQKNKKMEDGLKKNKKWKTTFEELE
jgi:hypothetical protein